jgi:hypothetical protein
MPIDEEDIQDLATSPKKVQGDEGTVEERPISEIIEADRYTSAKQANRVPWGMRMARIQKPGTP